MEEKENCIREAPPLRVASRYALFNRTSVVTYAWN